MPSFQPGDFLLRELTLAGRPVLGGLISFSIYQSIFTPCMVGEFMFRDSDDALFGAMNMSGGEELTCTMSVPGGESIRYKFLLAKPVLPEPSQMLKSKTVKLICTSEEAFKAMGGVSKYGYIQKSYAGKQISDIVKDVLKSYLGSEKNLDIEETKGSQNILAQNDKVWEFIDKIRRRAVSSSSKSSTYVFFENPNGFKFVTIESLFSGPVVKNLIQDVTNATDILKQSHNNIIGVENPDIFDAMTRIDRGTMKSSYSSFNFQTNEYTSKTVDFPGSASKDGGDGTWDSKEFVAKFGKYPGRTSILPYDNKLPVTNIPETTPVQLAYSGNLMQNTIRLRVFGDTKLKAGDLINAKLIRQRSLSTGPVEDTDVSGDMIIASVKHEVVEAGESPRYTCILECLKGRPA
jgi:hypothetical protein